MKKSEDPIDKQVREAESEILIASRKRVVALSEKLIAAIPPDAYMEEVESALVDVLSDLIRRRTKRVALRRMRI